jgi:histidine triad (HIT) family protein
LEEEPFPWINNYLFFLFLPEGGSMSQCIFCRIVKGEVKSEKVLEKEEFVAIHDINPQAPVHVLVIPRKHVVYLSELKEDPVLLGKLMQGVIEVSSLLPLRDGYRVVINTGTHGGQTVFHLHIHILGGRFMGWPPG